MSSSLVKIGKNSDPFDLPVVRAIDYWSKHTVHGTKDSPSSSEASLNYFHWRCDQYPGYLNLMPVSDLDGLDVIDFGCGPGHDLVGIGEYSKPKSLIGFDVSDVALGLARERLNLHHFGTDVSLRKLEAAYLDLPDSSVDYVHSSGVLHHLEDPLQALSEFKRVLRPNGSARIMIYNKDSIWWHLYVPYVLQIRRRQISPNLDIAEAFRMSTDGPGCPISRAYTFESFAALARRAGFHTEKVGACMSLHEIKVWRQYGAQALKDSRLASNHLGFLSGILEDDEGNLSVNGDIAGIDLVLELTHTR
jgi:ubiquinone/menaquinone biosynthesis C-methylase UbiE